jgi:hypothetical protein
LYGFEGAYPTSFWWLLREGHTRSHTEHGS